MNETFLDKRLHLIKWWQLYLKQLHTYIYYIHSPISTEWTTEINKGPPPPPPPPNCMYFANPEQCHLQSVPQNNAQAEG